VVTRKLPKGYRRRFLKIINDLYSKGMISPEGMGILKKEMLGDENE